MSQPLNLFATILTYAAPSANHRGESEENRSVLQKITQGNHDHAVISPASMRNALREILIKKELPMNRRRLHNEEQLAVEFKDYPDATTYADDYLFGYLVADHKVMKKQKRPSKRDSVLRMNMALSLEPYRFDASFHQSPLNAGESPWKNAATSALIHSEVIHTAFQFPFALAGSDVTNKQQRGWVLALVDAISELNGVAGGHARSYYEMAPRSIVARVSTSLIAGFNTYGFGGQPDFPELSRLNDDDLPGGEFWVAGDIVRDMTPEDRKPLEAAGVHLFDNPQRGLRDAAQAAFAS